GADHLATGCQDRFGSASLASRPRPSCSGRRKVTLQRTPWWHGLGLAICETAAGAVGGPARLGGSPWCGAGRAMLLGDRLPPTPRTTGVGRGAVAALGGIAEGHAGGQGGGDSGQSDSPLHTPPTE